MDNRIYLPTQRDYGLYGTRRFPKGMANTPIEQLPSVTSPADPNSNPTPVTLRFALAIGVAAAYSNVWRYIVPTRRRAELQSAVVHISRITANAGNNMLHMSIFLLRAFADPLTASEILRVMSHEDPNNIADGGHHAEYEGKLDLYEGDTLFSTGLIGAGTAALISSANLIEFDEVHKARQAVGQALTPPAAAGSGTSAYTSGGTGIVALRSTPATAQRTGSGTTSGANLNFGYLGSGGSTPPNQGFF